MYANNIRTFPEIDSRIMLRAYALKDDFQHERLSKHQHCRLWTHGRSRIESPVRGEQLPGAPSDADVESHSFRCVSQVSFGTLSNGHVAGNPNVLMALAFKGIVQYNLLVPFELTIGQQPSASTSWQISRFRSRSLL